MSPAVARRPGRAGALGAPTVALVVVALAAVALGLVMAAGVIDFSEAPPPPTTGLVAVPTPATTIPAYTRVNRDHLWDRQAGRLAAVYLPPSAVTPEMLVNLSDILGRVLDHDKAPGYVFTETDFLPAGTREGIVAGIPSGKRALRVTADEVEGLFGLRLGDRFDLLATLPIEARGGGGSDAFDLAGVYGQQLALEARLSNWQKQATVRVIVQSGVIVQPMSVRGVPTAQSALTDAGTSRVRPVQEAVVAVGPDEVALLAEAMAVDARIVAVPRSGRPDDPPNSRTPPLQPVNPFADRPEALGAGKAGGSPDPAFAVVETIMGQKRALTAVPRP
jgi:Flp pilus assembly protein CpaB